MKRIYRDLDHKMVAGICAGLGEMLDVDPTIVRLVVAFCTFFTGVAPGIIVYALGWFIIPEKKDVSGDIDKK